MVEYLKTKKGYFYKLKKNGKKKRISQKEYNKKNKTRRNKKMIGGGKIEEITENENETEIEQRYAIINYGYGPVSTYNLVNCIAIGGVFELDGNTGTFLTHESPNDFEEQMSDFKELMSKLNIIKEILDRKKAIITKIVIFCIDKPAITIYEGDLDTSKIIDTMINFSRSLFHLEPIIINYSCDISTMRCGKAIISPTQYYSELTKVRFVSHVKPSSSEKPLETFIVQVLYNIDGKKIYKCPICKTETGTAAAEKPTNTSLFPHNFDCPNKNKIPIEA
jgi:hypothetical protein